MEYIVFNMEMNSGIVFQQIRITKDMVENQDHQPLLNPLHLRALAEVLVQLGVDGEMLVIKLNINPVVVALQKIWDSVAVQKIHLVLWEKEIVMDMKIVKQN